MDFDGETAYQKLATTPLAQETKIFKMPAAVAGIILGILSALTGPIPCLVVGNWIMTGKYERAPLFSSRSSKDKSFDDPFFKKDSGTSFISDDLIDKICGGTGIAFSCIHLIGVVCLLIGACTKTMGFFYCWYVTNMCNILFAKLGFSIFMLVLGIVYYQYIVSLLILDIILTILILMTFGQIATISRNNRYMQIDYSAMRLRHL